MSLIFRVSIDKDTSGWGKIYLVTRIGNLNLGSHWSVCLNKMEIYAARECLESHRNMSFSVNSLFWLSYSIWCNHFLPPNSLLSLKSCVIGAMHGLQGFVDTTIHIELWLLLLICYHFWHIKYNIWLFFTMLKFSNYGYVCNEIIIFLTMVWLDISSKLFMR